MVCGVFSRSGGSGGNRERAPSKHSNSDNKSAQSKVRLPGGKNKVKGGNNLGGKRDVQS